MATNQDSAETLREEILAEARREGEEIVDRAQQEAEAAHDRRRRGGGRKSRQERLDQARAEAARRRELILATVPVEAGRLRVGAHRGVLESIREEARRAVDRPAKV